MKLFTFLLFFLLLCLSMIPLLSSPVSVGGLLVFTTTLFVSIFSMSSHMWYSYMLFLIYIGGLLVLFIYMCVVSTNYVIMGKSFKFMLTFLAIVYSMYTQSETTNNTILGFSGFETASEISPFLLVSLALALLLVFVAISKICYSGKAVRVGAT
uniref:NADH dehydrogenase subunit 6 n=1 Tax=Pedipes pedipes TaxID=999235 RepID=G8HPB0_9EUPU|nr:NADH dehydrogenase subunit 6 [Pedipes pedipes]AEQ93858.1 NADH dehydrogenase subunit 6 [Pedipes pedipes]